MKKLFVLLVLILFVSLNLSGNGQEQGVGIEKTIIYRVDLCINISLIAKQVGQNSDAYKNNIRIINFCNDPSSIDNPVPTIEQLLSSLKELNSEIENNHKNAIRNKDVQAIQGFNNLFASLEANSTAASSQKGIGLPSEAAIIIGLTDFLISRVKSEISISFAEDLSKWIENDKKLFILLRNTYDTLKNIDTLAFKSILPTLRESVIKDFYKLPETITDPIFESTLFSENRRQVLAQVVQRLGEILKGLDPISSLSKFFDLTDKHITDATTRQNFRILGLIARETNYYQPDAIKSILTDAQRTKLFLRFIENDLKPDKVNLINTDAALSLLRFINMIEDVKNIIDRLNAAKESTEISRHYIAYARAIADILELSQSIIQNTAFDDLSKFIRKGIDIQEALIEKNYTRLIAVIIDIINPLISEPNLIISKQIAEKANLYKGLDLSHQKIKELKNKIGSWSQISKDIFVESLKNLVLDISTINLITARLDQTLLVSGETIKNDDLYKELNLSEEIKIKIKNINAVSRTKFIDNLRSLRLDISAINIIAAKLDQNKKGSEKIFRILAFAANLASAKTSEDVQKALEAAADPVGSFRAKRAKTGGCYFTVNGYFGASMPGGEWQEGRLHRYLAKMSVPLGMEFGWSLGGRSVGIFGSFLDLGNIAYYRIKTEGSSKNEKPSLGFDQIFAPGCFIIFGVSNNYPISYGVGYQYLPKLREISSDVSRINVHRISLFIGIDLALFRF